MFTETIDWHHISPPDENGRVHDYPEPEITKLLHMPDGEGEAVWPGYWDGLEWMLADGMPAPEVDAWADMPRGPR